MKTVIWRKVAIIIIAVATMSASAAAQKQGEMAAGANLLFGTTSGYSNVGLGAKFLYNVTDPIRLAGEFDYFFKKDYTNMWDVSIYGHYLFPVADKIEVYPSVGLGVVGSRASIPTISIPGYGIVGGSASHSDFAFSLGAGADYELTSNLALNAEFRIKFITGSWYNFLVGVAYKF